jgi:hypothetical protein
MGPAGAGRRSLRDRSRTPDRADRSGFAAPDQAVFRQSNLHARLPSPTRPPARRNGFDKNHRRRPRIPVIHYLRTPTPADSSCIHPLSPALWIQKHKKDSPRASPFLFGPRTRAPVALCQPSSRGMGAPLKPDFGLGGVVAFAVVSGHEFHSCRTSPKKKGASSP